MYPVNIVTDKLNILFPKHKEFNPVVNWMDMTVYFRVNGKMFKRKTVVLSKAAALKDYETFKKVAARYDWEEEQIKEQKKWNLSGHDDVASFKKSKKTFVRHLYDIPEVDEDPEEDLLYSNRWIEHGAKPYMTEIVLPDKTLDIQSMRKAAAFFIKECFDIKVNLKKVYFINRFTDERLKEEWKSYCEQKRKMEEFREKGIRPAVVFRSAAAKYLLGDEVKEYRIEGSKRITKFEDGTQTTKVLRDFKVVKFRKK